MIRIHNTLQYRTKLSPRCGGAGRACIRKAKVNPEKFSDRCNETKRAAKNEFRPPQSKSASISAINFILDRNPHQMPSNLSC